MVIVVNWGYMLCYYLEKFWCKSYKNNLFLNFVVLLMMEQIKITSVVSLSSGQDKRNMFDTSVHECRDPQGSSVQMENNIQNNQATADPISTPPPLCHLDVEVIRNLPPEVFSELNEIYGGKLVEYIAKGKGTSESSSSLRNSFLEQEGKLVSLSLFHYCSYFGLTLNSNFYICFQIVF